jgi:hypothetical protein
LDSPYLKPIEQVGAESASGHLSIEIPIRRREDADVDFFNPAAHWPDLTLFDCSKQLGLDVEWEFANFIKKQRATMGLTEETATFSNVGPRILDGTK